MFFFLIMCESEFWCKHLFLYDLLLILQKNMSFSCLALRWKGFCYGYDW